MRRWCACGKLKYWCHAARPASDPFQEIGCFQDCDQAAHSCTRFWLFRGLPAETCVELESRLSTASWGCELLRQHEMTREAKKKMAAVESDGIPGWSWAWRTEIWKIWKTISALWNQLWISTIVCAANSRGSESLCVISVPLLYISSWSLDHWNIWTDHILGFHEV